MNMKIKKTRTKAKSLAVACSLLLGLVSVLTSTNVSAQTVISPNTNFTTNGVSGLNGFNGAANTSDNLVFTPVPLQTA